MLTGAQQHSLSSAACAVKVWEIQTEEDSYPSPCRPKQPLNYTVSPWLLPEMEISFDLPSLWSGFRRHKTGLWPFFRAMLCNALCCIVEEVKCFLIKLLDLQTYSVIQIIWYLDLDDYYYSKAPGLVV